MDVLGSDFIRTACQRSGTTDRRLQTCTQKRGDLVITIAGLQFHTCSRVRSKPYSPGLVGTLLLNQPGIPTIMGILFFSAMVVIIFNLLTDLAYRLVDPRIRMSNTA